MFLGHFGLALASKRLEPRVSLATSVFAAQLADTLWPILVLSGVERVAIAPGDTVVTPLRFESYPYSHSLLSLLVLGGLVAGTHFFFRRNARAAAVLLSLVVSHWFLDYLSHRPDMPLTPWAHSLFGLGLWNSLPLTLLAEAGLFAVGAGLALRSTRAKDAIGRYGIAGFLVFLVLVYAAAVFGPPPPSVEALGWTSLAAPVLLLPVLAWVDNHRAPR